MLGKCGWMTSCLLQAVLWRAFIAVEADRTTRGRTRWLGPRGSAAPRHVSQCVTHLYAPTHSHCEWMKEEVWNLETRWHMCQDAYTEY